MSSMLMLVISTLSLSNDIQDKEAALPPELVRIAQLERHLQGTVHMFKRKENAPLIRDSGIPIETRQFCEGAIRRSIRISSDASFQWIGYVASGYEFEVTMTSWTSRNGLFIWVDNGYRASLRCELRDQILLEDELSVIDFVETFVPEVLNAPFIDKSRFHHRLKPYGAAPIVWSGVVLRGVQMQEEVLASGEQRLRQVVEHEWHQDMEITTDGRAITMSFTMPESQKSPYGNSPTPGHYRPFRFSSGKS